MHLVVTQDTQGDTVSVQGGGSVPSIDTRSLTTQVLVDNGETVVLGGIYEQQDINNTGRIPVLGKIPLIGALFRNNQRKHDKRELLLFVTPKIIKEDLTIPASSP
jgi:type IV pilus assembly protein PilQ